MLNQSAVVDHSKDEGPSDSSKVGNIIASCEGEYLAQISDAIPAKFISKSDLALFKARFGLNPPAEKPSAEVSKSEEPLPKPKDLKEVEVEAVVKEDKLVIDEDIDVGE